AAAVGDAAHVLFAAPAGLELAGRAAVTRGRVLVVAALDALVDTVTAVVALDVGDRAAPAGRDGAAVDAAAVAGRRIAVVAGFRRVEHAVAADLAGPARRHAVVGRALGLTGRRT